MMHPHSPCPSPRFLPGAAALLRAVALLLAAAALLPAGCERGAPPQGEEPALLTRAAVSAEDGMILLDYPGPKGQVRRKDGVIDYFCDTVGLLNALHDPDRRHLYDVASVQAFDGRDWGSYPDGWVRADTAVYAIDSDRMGAMGPTLVPFRERAAAEAFIAAHNGRLVTFAQIDPALLAAHAQRTRELLRGGQPMGAMSSHSMSPPSMSSQGMAPHASPTTPQPKESQ